MKETTILRHDVVFDTAVTPMAYAGPNTLDLTPAVKSLLGLQ